MSLVKLPSVRSRNVHEHRRRRLFIGQHDQGNHKLGPGIHSPFRFRRTWSKDERSTEVAVRRMAQVFTVANVKRTAFSVEGVRWRRRSDDVMSLLLMLPIVLIDG